MAGRIRTALRTVPAAVAMAAVAAGTAPGAGAAPSLLAEGTESPAWEIGDCFEDADIDTLAVDLETKVSCARDHAAQVIGGGDLPSSLASYDFEGLISTTGSERAALDRFVDETCAPGEVAANVYPKKTARALARLFDEYDVTYTNDWMLPLAGDLVAMLPDPASFDAGARAVLCVYVTDVTFSGATDGDARKVASGPLLESLRLCADRGGSGSDFVTCDDPHDLEGLIWLWLPVDGLPSEVADWPDTAWEAFDEVCGEFAPVVVGATRKDLAYRANTNGEQPAFEGRRRMWCEAFPADDDAALPGGVTVSGIGKKKIRFASV